MRSKKLETRKEKLQMIVNNFKKNNIEEPKEIKSLNWLNKNKFKEILVIIDSNKFNYKNKIGELTLKTWLITLRIIQLVK